MAKTRATFILLGPTGTGKSALAYRLASSLNGEIISADSVQVYKGLDKGTAKPDAMMRKEIRHHLVSIVDPATNYCAAQFVRAASQALDDIRARGKIAIIAGGTMFYVYALLNGLSALPPASSSIRTKYLALAAGEGVAALHNRLQQLDKEAADRIHRQDKQRLLRALEVIDQTGQPLSQLQGRAREGGIKEGLAKRGERILTFSLLFPNRMALHQRLALRFQSFIEDGLIDEVRELKKRPDLSLERSSIRSVGYRQIWEYLDGAYGYDEMLHRSIAATRQLAKNQLVWLRGWKDSLHPLDANLATDRLAEYVMTRQAE